MPFCGPSSTGPAWPMSWSWSWSSAWVRRSGRVWLHPWQMSRRAEYMFALYSGSLAEPGDRNPYAGDESLVLPKLWLRGYMRMLRVRIETGPGHADVPRRACCGGTRSG